MAATSSVLSEWASALAFRGSVTDEEIQEHDIEEGSRFFVRITDLPLQDKLRELRCELVLCWCRHSSAMQP